MTDEIQTDRHDAFQDLARVAARLSGATGAQIRTGPSWRPERAASYRTDSSQVATGQVLAAAPIPGTDGQPWGEITVLGATGAPELDADRLDDLAALGRIAAAFLAGERDAELAFDAQEATARAEEQLTRVAGQIAHDLNNPLAAVSMCLEIAGDQVEESQTLLTSLLDRAAGSAARMKQMTGDLMAYAHQPAPGTTDLQAELDAALAALEGLVPGEVVTKRSLPTVAGQPGDYRVVIVGLLENAIKFAAEGEPVHLTVDAEPLGEQWRITFADRGRGIDAQERERVLEPAVRLDKRVPGMGLGLSTARRVVTAHGGQVGVEENPGGGTTVWFTLPALATR